MSVNYSGKSWRSEVDPLLNIDHEDKVAELPEEEGDMNEEDLEIVEEGGRENSDSSRKPIILFQS